MPTDEPCYVTQLVTSKCGARGVASVTDKKNEQKKLRTPIDNNKAPTVVSLSDWYREALNRYSIFKAPNEFNIDTVPNLIPPTKPTLH